MTDELFILNFQFDQVSHIGFTDKLQNEQKITPKKKKEKKRERERERDKDRQKLDS